MASVATATRKYFQQAVVAVLPDDAFVWYGSKLNEYSAPITLEILSWRGQSVPAELSPEARREETFELVCCITSFQGDVDFDAREDECWVNWTNIWKMVGNDYTLGGNVRWAQMTQYEFVTSSNVDSQSIGSLDFTVECQQRVDSLR